MINVIKIKRVLFVLFCAVTMAQAGVNPIPLATDSRMRVIPYDRNQVTQLKCHYDVETTIEYAANETIIRATAGQRVAWNIVQSEVRGNILTIQPKLNNADTNLTVITDKRVYLYELKAREQWNLRGKDIVFFLRYQYPNEVNRALEVRTANKMARDKQESEFRSSIEQRNKIDPTNINLAYTFAGNRAIAPIAVFDDGLFTYFEFDKQSELPAIYTVDHDRQESMLNHRIQGKYIVVERLANRFTLRSGTQVTTVTRGKQVVRRMDTSSATENNTTPDW